MTVYVDDSRIPARVGRITGRWSHLTADTKDELHAFAQRIGLKRAWFQDKWPHWHYDVTDSKRDAAIAAGAQPIDLRQFGEILRARHRSTKGRES